MKCAVFYGDGGLYEGASEGVESPIDVQAVVYPDASHGPHSIGWLVMKGWDYYLLEDNAWVGVTGEADLVDHLLWQRPDRVLKGRMIPKCEWHEIIAEATAYAKKMGRSAKARGFEEPVDG